MVRQFIVCFVALLAVGSAVQATLFEQCHNLNRRIGDTVIKSNDKDVVYKAIMNDNQVYGELRDAISAVHEHKSCNDKTMGFISDIEKCQAGKLKHLAFIQEDAQEVIDKCFPQKYWTDAVRKAEANIKKAFKKAFPYFIGDDMKSKYDEETKNDPDQGMKLNAFGDCCHPNKAAGMIADGLVRYMADQQQTSTEEAKSFLKGNSKAIIVSLEGSLSYSCNVFNLALSPVIHLAKMMERVKPNFLETMSPEFKDTVFRFKYCTKTVPRRDSQMNEFAKLIAAKL